MPNRYDRRELLKGVGAACAARFFSSSKPEVATQNLQIASRRVEVQIAPVSTHTFRLTVSPIDGGQPQAVKGNGSLVQAPWAPPAAKLTGGQGEHVVRCGQLHVKLSLHPIQALVITAKGEVAQKLIIDSETGAVSFSIGDSALLGLGEGRPAVRPSRF